MPEPPVEAPAAMRAKAPVLVETSAAPAAEASVSPSEQATATPKVNGSAAMPCAAPRFKTTDTFAAFDTVVSISLVYADSKPETNHAAQAAFQNVRAFCEECENLFSRTLPTSDISRINRSAGQCTPVAGKTAQLILRALPYCAKSRGAFDITMGSVTPLWDFKQGIEPSAAQIDAALAHVAWQRVHVFQENECWFVQLASPKCALDLGGIAKGWIADEIGALLSNAGFSNFLINLGGNVLARGRNDQGKPWTIQVENPFGNPDEAILVHTTDASLVTSGTYERCFMKNGILLHHILSPRTGRPVESDAVSATIVCKKSIDAEGFSTTALALGVHEGIAFCQEQPEIAAAFFIDVNGGIHAYEGHDAQNYTRS